MFLFILSFVAGALTVLAPCTLPLLPVIVGESVAGKSSRGRALVVIGSLGASLFVFTLLLKVSTAFISVPPQVWQWLSGGLIIIFGVITLVPELWERFAPANALNKSSNRLLGQGYLKRGVWGDALMGVALGPVFSSCSPTYFIVLATVLPTNFSLGILYLLVYILGLCLALFAIALLGQRLVGKLDIASNPHGWFKRSLGVLFLVVGIAIFFGIDRTIERSIATHAGIFDVTRIEQAALLAHQDAGKGTPQAIPAGLLSPAEKMLRYQKVPELASPDAYLNTGGVPITLAQYRGKNVVLVDFWTYSCINCQRTLPYLTTWYGKYKDQGLIIIGVHTPEFAFEHEQANVADALKRFGITYPVVLDNEYKTWNAFGNQFWPREYLVDIDGYIVHDHSGEGEYDVTEKAIQAALAERAARLGTSAVVATSTVSITPADLSGIGSPETYFGSARNQLLANGTRFTVGTQQLTLPQSFSLNQLYLGGAWNFMGQYATAQDGDEIAYRYSAKKVYVVASADSPVTVEVLQDGKPIGSAAGADVPVTGIVTIGSSRLYEIVANPEIGSHLLQLKVHGTGARFYTFTFG
jgi:cytochrome c biogenesis protein CcdA/thiol-disulfide isomerase/thioredoxin